jgi:hypothetical protein
MGYTISAELPNQKEQETLLILLKKIIDSEHFNSHAYISRDHSEHGYSVKLEHGIYISFSILDHAELLFFHNVLSEITNRFNTSFYYDDEKIKDHSIRWDFKNRRDMGATMKIWYYIFGIHEEKRLINLKNFYEEISFKN